VTLPSPRTRYDAARDMLRAFINNATDEQVMALYQEVSAFVLEVVLDATSGTRRLTPELQEEAPKPKRRILPKGEGERRVRGVLADGPASRADLLERTGLSSTSLHSALKRLLERGEVQKDFDGNYELIEENNHDE